VFLGIKFVIIPPAVSIPIDNGATSKSKTFWMVSDWELVKIAA